MTDYDYDLFVIGAGSGGVRAARMAAGFGAKTAIAEEHRVGGTCVIRGCVPKKLFVYASHYAEDAEDAAGYGWTFPKGAFSWETLLANKDKEIDRLNGIYIKNLNAAGVEIFDTRAVLEDAHTLRLEKDARTCTAKMILIATGAAPFLPSSVPGIEHAISSNEAFHLETLPKRVVIVGGGYIAVEFAGIFNGLGVETMLVYRGEEILRGFDDDVRGHLHEAMVAKGIDVRVGTNIAQIAKKGDGFAATLEDGGVLDTELVMYATGRRPCTEGLGLEAAGVACAKNGAVEVDAWSQTNVPHIYAVGDATDRVNLTPVAIREGAAFAQTCFNNTPMAVDHSIVASAVFSQPQIGSVGLTEARARQTHKNIDIYKSVFTALKHTLTGNNEKVMMKLIVDADTDRVLGVHIMGGDAGELIQAIGIAVQMGATKAQFDATIAVHPTSAEELVTMSEKTG